MSASYVVISRDYGCIILLPHLRLQSAPSAGYTDLDIDGRVTSVTKIRAS